jgi:transposase
MHINRPVTEEDWNATPEPVRRAYEALEKQVLELTRRIEKLEAMLNMNSQNSSKPPSSDSPFKKPAESQKPKKKKKAGAKKGHRGHRQTFLNPTETIVLKPGPCLCGNSRFPKTVPYYTHQIIELPEIQMEVTHLILHRGKCPCCGKRNKALIPKDQRTGYGPRLSAFIAEMTGIFGNSRTSVADFCDSVFGFHISLGTIQKVINRASAAINPHYEKIAEITRSEAIAHIDETSFPQNGTLAWLWVMATSVSSLFMIHPNRSKKAFEELIQDWAGILVSDNYGVYRKWIGLRQTCLAHLIRKARALSEMKNPEIARFGTWALSELQRLCHMANAPPTTGEWNAFYARLIRLISLHHDREDEAGTFARRLAREMESLWVFLEHEGVSPTNNHAERMLRFAVLWRNRSQGTASEKGERWVERILSLRQTCRLAGRKTYPVLVDAMDCFFKEQIPDISWIGRPVNQAL